MKLASRLSGFSSKSKFAILAAVAVAGAVQLSSATAATFSWSTATNGNWDDTSKWTPSGTPVAGDIVNFNDVGINGNETIYLNGNRAATSIVVANTGTTTLLGGISGGPANNTLTLGAGSITVNAGAGAVVIGDTAGSPTAKVDVVFTAGYSFANNSSNVLTFANAASVINSTYSVSGTAGTVITGNVTQTAAGTTTFTNTADLTIGGFITTAGGPSAITVNSTGTMTINGNITQGAGNTLSINRTTAAGTLILKGTSNLTGAVTITGGSIQTAVTTGAFGTPSAGLQIGGAGTLALRGDASATFTNPALTAYAVATTGSGATIDVNQVTAAPANTVLTLGTFTFGGAHTANFSGGNVGLALGAATGTGNSSRAFTNNIDPTTAPQGLTIASYTEVATTATTLTFNGAGNTTVTGAITQNVNGTLAVSYTGSGSLTLNGANAYNGTTTINNAAAIVTLAGSNSGSGVTTLTNGTLRLAGASVDPLASGQFNFNGGTLQATTAGHILNNTTVLGGSPTVSGANSIQISGSFTNSGGNRNLASSITGGNTLTISGNVFLSELSGTGRTMTLSGTGNTTISGVIANFNGAGTAGGLTITNTGLTILSNTNTYTGTTTINTLNSTVRITGALGGNGPVSFSNATLQVGATNALGTGLVTYSSNNGAIQSFGGAFGVANQFNIGGIMTVSGSNALTFNGPISDSGSGTVGQITFNNSALTTLSGGVPIRDTGTGARTFTWQGTGNVLVNSIISDGSAGAVGSLVYNGSGVVTFSGNNTYTGTTTWNSGVLNIQHANALGSTAANTSVASGATLQLETGITTAAEPLSLAGAGAAGQTGALVNVSGNNTFSGTVNLTGAATISSNSGVLTLGAANAVTGNQALTLTGAGDGVVGGTITTGANSLTKSGTGTWTLSQANTYTGATSVTNGKLIVTGSLANSATDVTAGADNTTATLASNSSIAGPVTISSPTGTGRSNIVAPGNGTAGDIATLTITNTLAIQSGAIGLFDVNPTLADKIAGVTALPNIVAGTNINVNFLAGSYANNTWDLITWTGAALGTLPTLNVTNLPGGATAFLSTSSGKLTLNLTGIGGGTTPASITVSPVNGSTLASGGSVTVTNTAIGATVDPAVLSAISVTDSLPTNGTWGQAGLTTADISGNGGNQIGSVTATPAANTLAGAKITGTLSFHAAGKTQVASSGEGNYSYPLSSSVASNSAPTGAGTTYGTAQTAAVASGDKVSGLSTTESSSLTNTLTFVDSTTLGGLTTATAQWRHRSVNETYPGANPPLPSNITSLITDVAKVDLGANAPTAYVLQMSYDPAGLGGLSETLSFNADHLYLAHMTPDFFGADTGDGGLEDRWQNATLDSGNPQLGVLRAYQPSDLATIGSWGVDTVAHVAWAVMPGTETGQFAVVPEPASLGLLAMGAAGLLLRRKR